MATSGAVNFNMTASDIIEAAYQLIGKKREGNALTAAQTIDGILQLNLLLKTWVGTRVNLWTQEEGILFLDVSKENYLLGATGDEATTLDDFVGTTSTAAAATSATAITVTSTTGMTASDNVGVELDDATRHWTTIVSVDSTTQITITSGLASAAASGNSVFTFTNLIERPTEMLQIRREVFAQDNEITVETVSRDTYFAQTNKGNKGTVTMAYYSPQLTNGRLYIWQTASTVNNLVTFTFKRTLENVGASTNNLDAPQEWLNTIVWNLAELLGVVKGTVSSDAPRYAKVEKEAAELLRDLKYKDQEKTGVQIIPSSRGRVGRT